MVVDGRYPRGEFNVHLKRVVWWHSFNGLKDAGVGLMCLYTSSRRCDGGGCVVLVQ